MVTMKCKCLSMHNFYPKPLKSDWCSSFLTNPTQEEYFKTICQRVFLPYYEPHRNKQRWHFIITRTFDFRSLCWVPGFNCYTATELEQNSLCLDLRRQPAVKQTHAMVMLIKGITPSHSDLVLGFVTVAVVQFDSHYLKLCCCKATPSVVTGQPQEGVGERQNWKRFPQCTGAKVRL